MIDVKQQQTILDRINQTAKQHDVKVVFAVESGSRAWGLASPKSDYDVRFVYIHRPEWYLSIDLEARPDVIEYPLSDTIDLQGWDLRKALKLFHKSNPSFIEWIQSPIQYLEYDLFSKRCRGLLPDVYNPGKGIYHYLNMAKTNFRQHLLKPQIPIKKYLYVLKALLAARCIQTHRSAPPIEFQQLISLLPTQPLHQLVEELIEKKKSEIQQATIEPNVILNDFINEEFDFWESNPPTNTHSHDCFPALNALFQELIYRF